MKNIIWWSIAVAILLGTAFLEGGQEYSRVYLFNGLSKPVEVEVGAYHWEVPARGHLEEKLATDLYPTIARQQEKVLESILLAVEPDKQTVYNIGGIAPVYLEKVYYNNGHRALPAIATVPINVGLRQWSDAIAYPLQNPPEQITNHGSVYLSHLGVVKGGGAEQLVTLGHLPGLFQVLERARKMEPENAALKRATMKEALLSLGAGPTLRWLQENEGDPKLVRGLELLLQPIAEEETLSASYQAHPDDPDALLQYTERLPVASSLPLLLQFRERHPENKEVQRAYAVALSYEGSPTEVLELLRDLAPAPLSDLAKEVALLKSGEAKTVYDTLPASLKPDDLTYQARLENFLEFPFSAPVSLAAARARLYANPNQSQESASHPNSGEPSVPQQDQTLMVEEEQQLFALEWHAIRDPQKAWDLFQKKPAMLVTQMDAPLRYLLAMEYLRVGDTKLAATLLRPVTPEFRLEASVVDPDAPVPPEFQRPLLSLQAALYFVRSRALEEKGRWEEATQLREKALKTEVIPGPVHAAAQKWEAPKSKKVVSQEERPLHAAIIEGETVVVTGKLRTWNRRWLLKADDGKIYSLPEKSFPAEMLEKTVKISGITVRPGPGDDANAIPLRMLHWFKTE